eukprot:jgi/Ulvmu1/7796/UM004_0025.1
MSFLSNAIRLGSLRLALLGPSSPALRSFTSSSRDTEPDVFHLINSKVPISTALEFHGSLAGPACPMPVFRMLRSDGSGLVRGADHHVASNDMLLAMYKTMVTTQAMDTVFYDSQRQGRFGFYMTCTGEEASIVGSAAALESDDVIFCQYREHAAFLWRGFTVQEMANQCFGNAGDPSKGRQMPIHYGSADLNMVTVSSVVATQAPHAVGAAYALKLRKEKRITATYFGDGGTSEGDSHAAFLFSTTLECPVVFLCRNNGFAISTPSFQNFAGPGVSERAAAYGIRTIRVDGGDALAVFAAVREARRMALDGNCPCLVELMTYRVGHHSTSDDSARYREADEMALWRSRDPVDRLRCFLEAQGLWDKEKEATLRREKRRECTEAMRVAGSMPKHPSGEIFTDVYKDMPEHLLEQQQDMLATLRRFPELSPPGVPTPES